jgi:hypothetical protein
MPREVLTSEEEQTADQLLADIQSAVDEMLNDFQTNNLSPESTPPSSQPPLPTSSTASIDKVVYIPTSLDYVNLSPPLLLAVFISSLSSG